MNVTTSTNQQAYARKVDALRKQLNRALVGKADVVEQVITCLLAKGHLLFDDLPGLGKTTLAKALAKSVGGNFARVQCTPDLLPSDITGFNIFDQKNQTFEFREGPVFSDSLFEAMAERQVTIDNKTMPLTPSFMVIATQNPVESHGAYPLPEAQLDRFAVKLSIGYPNADDEVSMLGQFVGDEFENRTTEPALTLADLSELQSFVANVEVCEAVRKYLVELGNATPKVELGLSPRGLIIWQRVAQSWAFLQGRTFVTPADIQAVAVPVLKLRIGSGNENCAPIIQQILESITVPNETK